MCSQRKNNEQFVDLLIQCSVLQNTVVFQINQPTTYNNFSCLLLDV